MSAYKDLKNYIHNTLEITKEQVREMVEQAVERIVERKLEVMFKKYWSIDDRDGDYSLYTMERVIDSAIREKGMDYWMRADKSFDSYIKDRVVQELLNGVSLKVEVKQDEKRS